MAVADLAQAMVLKPFLTAKPTGQGTRLGLSLSYAIITQGHGGTMAVESEEGQGATFVITLGAVSLDQQVGNAL